MSNTLVYGKAAPIQVAGAQSQGSFFQNLGTNPIYVGYSTSVNSGYFDGIIQPGGTYTSGPGRSVYLYADADTPVVYNDDPSASADAGNSITATIPGTLATTVTNVPTVNASGSAVSATSAQEYVTLLGNTRLSVGKSSSTSSLGGGITYDVSGYQSILITHSGTQSGGTAAPQDPTPVAYILRWIDPDGVTLFSEYVLFFAGGLGFTIVPAKGARVQFLQRVSSVQGIAADPSYNYDITYKFVGSTMPLEEYYISRPSTGIPTRRVLTGTTSGTVSNDPVVNGLSSELFTTLGANSEHLWLMPSLNREVNGTSYVNPGGQTSVLAMQMDQPYTNAAIVQQMPGTAGQYNYYSMKFPRAPIILDMLCGNASTNFQLTFQYGNQ